MFEKLTREIQRLNGSSISIPISSDKDGYVDRQCPSDNCKYSFKVYSEDWRNLFKDEAVRCPLCGYSSEAVNFVTEEQREAAREQAINHAHHVLGTALRSSVQSFNHTQNNNSLFQIKMSVSGGSQGHYPVLPISAKEILELKVVCDQCGARYAILGSAFFCPNCGQNSVEQTFEGSLRKIESKLNYLDEIRAAIPDKDSAELACRSLVETALSDCVVSFQFFCECLYDKSPNKQSKIPQNVFQKIDVGESLWQVLFGESYSNWLNQGEIDQLICQFQRRHLLAHKEGIVDQKYIDKSGDHTYKVGQRIVVNATDVKDVVNVITKITNKIKELS